ncbi:gliding motility-associated C-terminal domain-containing protein [Chitinophaga japonensis]|nr:gliding motility-associated C-terminal domain-containing protein [Chitinophaga japonensis]
MKKILALLFVCLGFARGTALGQHMNAPARVCSSTDPTNQRYATVSISGYNGTRTTWTIERPAGTLAVQGTDFNILYGDYNTPSTGAGVSDDNRSMTIEFLRAGTYTVRAVVRNGGPTSTPTANITRTIVVENCPMDICRGQNTNMAGFMEDFGSTTTRIELDPSRGEIEYDPQLTNPLNDNYYSISNQMQLRPEWEASLDHTGNTNGAMLVANSAIQPMLFYSRRVNGLCTGATYNFSAWFRNANGQQVLENSCQGGYIYAGVTFEILNAANNALLASFNTNDVSMPLQANPPNRGWQLYGGSFKTPPGVSDVIVQIRNNNPGGCGNDIAIDDISFAYCAPYIYSFFDGQMDQLGGEYTMCAGAATNLTSAYTPSDYFNDPRYFWQYSDDGVNWTTIAGDGDGLTGYNTSVLHFAEDALLLIGHPTVITERYFRLMIYEGGNDYTTCAQPSVPIKVILLPNPRITVAGAQICIGSSATLTACCGYDTYTWDDPAATEAESLTVSPTTTTTYTVTGRKDYGSGRTCYRTAEAPVIVDDMPVLNLNLTGPNPICIGQSVDLSIDAANAIYDIVWEPTGDITTDITDTPGSVGTHEYKVTVTNGACEAKDSIDIVVQDQPDVTLGAIPASCNNTGSFTIPFSNPVNNPQRYDIVAAGANPMPGFTAISNQTLSGTSITVPYPVGTAPGTYTFNLVLRNPALSCERTKSFSVTIAAPSTPPTGIAASTTQICVNGPVTLTVQGGNLATGAQWVWYAGGCGSGTPLGTGNTITVNISATTTFYVRAVNASSPCPATTCASTTVNVYPMPGNVDAGPDQNHCEDSVFNMVANQPSANTAKAVWSIISSSVPASQIIIEDVTREDTRIIVPKGATVTLNWGTPDGVCPGKDDQITLTNYINPASLANAGPDQKRCNVTSFTLNATTISSVPTASGTWSVVYTSGATPTISSLTNPAATVTVAAGDSVVLRWTVTNGICPAASDDVTLVSYRQPTTAAAGPDQRLCNVTSFTLAGNTPTVGTGRWTVVYGPNANITNPASPTSTVTVNAGDSIVLRWTISNGTCTASSDNVTLVSYRQPTTAAAGPDQRLCNVTSFTLAGNTPTAGTGRWTIVYGPNANITNPASPTSTVTANVGDSIVLRWTISNGVCTPSSDEVTLVSYRQPTTAAAGPDQRLCNVTSFTLAANTPSVGTGRWTVIYGPNASIANPASPTSTVTVNAGDSVVLRWTVSNGACTPSTDDVTLVSYRQPTTAAAGPDQRLCNVTSFTLAANAPAVGTGRWTIIYGPNATITNPASRTSTVTVNAGDSIVLRWTITNGVCAASSDDVTLVSYRQPTTAAAGPDQKLCNVTSFTLAGNTPAVGTGRWTIVYGAASITNPNSPTSTVTVAVGDSVILRWSVTNGNCPASTDDVTLVSYAQPTTAAAGPDQRGCNVTSFTLAGNTPTVGTGRWTVVYGPNANIANPASPTSTVTLNAGDSVVLRWTITNGTCAASSDNVTLVSYRQAAAAAAGPDQKLCNVTSFTLNANAPSVATATGTWTRVFGNPAISNINDPNATVTVAVGDSVVLRWTITNGTCAATSDNITLVSYAQPTTAAAGPDQRLCNVTSFTLAGNTPTVGAGRWTVVYGPNANIANPASPTSTVTVNAGDSVVLRWTITNGTCAASTDDVTLVSYRLPSTAAAGPDREQCNNATFTLAATAPAVGTGRWTVVAGSATIANPASPTSTVQVPAGASATLRWTVTNGPCAASTDDVVLSNLNVVAGNTISADQTICANETAAPIGGGTITGGNGTYTYQWQRSTTSGTTGFTNIPGATAATYAPGTVSQDSIWFRRVVTSGPCASSISNAVKIYVITRPPVVVFVPAPMTVNCRLGMDYTTLFGTPQFSHTPYINEPLTITFSDASTISGCTRTFTRTWTATDRCGLTTTASQTITVVDTEAPVFTSTRPADITVNCDAIPAAVNLNAYDSCSGAIVVTPVETRQDIPGACASNYRIIRTWTATDGCNNSATLTQTITVQDTTRPVFSVTPPRDTTVNCDAVPAAPTLTATDNCTPGTITVTATDTRQNIPGACASNYLIIRTWMARDECGNTATVQQTITVQDTARPVFSIPQPADVTVECDGVPAWPAVTATDNCSSNVQVVTSEQRTDLQPNCGNNYRLIRTWTATDNCGNTASMQQVITVQDTTGPVFTVLPPADTTVNCDQLPPPANNVAATDNCAGNVTISRGQVRETIPGACSSNYRLIRTWTATDACGNTSVVRQIITVQDTTGPVLAPAPADLVLNCGDAIPAAPQLTATDNCDPGFPRRVTAVEDPYTRDVCAGYTIIRRWRITDNCGNQSAEMVQRITVNPCPKPELDPVLPVNCSDNPVFTLQLQNNVSNPIYTLVGVTPANAVQVPLSQASNMFNLNGATQASFIVQDGVTGCVSDTVTYDLQYSTRPMVNLGRDTTICGGNNLILDAGAANFNYTIRWSTGETTQRINVSTAGTYWVTVTNGVCVTTDTIRVDVIPMPLVNLPDASICRGQSVKLDAFVDDATYLWSTGATTSSILVSTQEEFWVRVTKSGCITIDTVNVTVNPPPDISLNRDTAICPDQSIMLTVNVLNGGDIRWATGATSPSIVVNEPGLYWVTVTRDNCMVRDTVNVRLQPGINVELGPNREICPGGRITIDGTTQDAISYLWDDGDPNPVKQVDATGKYRLAVMDRFCQRVYMDSVKVWVTSTPYIELGNDTMMCIGETLRLRADGSNVTSVLWSDGSTGPFLDVTRAGTYTVTVFNDCGSYTDQITVDYTQCDPKPTFPNAFSPNGDGRNDSFRPVVKGPMYEYELRIFNRWGELIYLGRDSKKGWDGRYHGEPVGVGTYVWWLTYKKMPGGNPNVIKGEVTVIK